MQIPGTHTVNFFTPSGIETYCVPVQTILRTDNPLKYRNVLSGIVFNFLRENSKSLKHKPVIDGPKIKLQVNSGGLRGSLFQCGLVKTRFGEELIMYLSRNGDIPAATSGGNYVNLNSSNIEEQILEKIDILLGPVSHELCIRAFFRRAVDPNSMERYLEIISSN